MQRKTRRLVAQALLACAVGATLSCRAEDAQLLRAKTQLLVEQAGEMYGDACRKGSETHNAAYQYYFGLIYSSGTNLLARSESPTTTSLLRKYADLIGKNYDAYTKVEAAAEKAAATGSVKGKNGSRHRAKRLVNAEKLRDAELATAIKQWESFVIQLKKTR